MEQFTHATVVEWISCLPLVNTTSTSTWLGSKHKQQATTGVKYECSMHFTRVQAPPPVVKVQTLNAFYQEHIIHLLLFWQLQNCGDSVKVAWKGGNPLLHQIALLWLLLPQRNNQPTKVALHLAI